MTLKSAIMWLVAVAALIFGVWLCLGATGYPVPPAPKLPNPVLRSPKDQAAQPAAVIIPLVPFLHTNMLKWTQNGTNVGNVIEYKATLTSEWVEMGRTTNVYQFKIYSTNQSGFYRVGAFWL